MVTVIPDSTRPLIEQILSLESTSQAKEESYNRVQRNLENRIKIAENRVKLLERDNGKMNATIESLRESEREKIERARKLEEEARQRDAQLEELRKKSLDQSDLTKDLRTINEDISNQNQELRKELDQLKHEIEAKKTKQLSIAEPTIVSNHSENNVRDNVEMEKSTTVSQDQPTMPKLLTLESTIRTQTSQIKALLDRVDSLEQAKSNLNEDLFIINSENRNLKDQIAEQDKIRASYEQLRIVHDNALELLGEKEERLIELEQDMQYVKDTFRKQVMDLLSENESLRANK
jgi:chromosome segregation ATPase